MFYSVNDTDKTRTKTIFITANRHSEKFFHILAEKKTDLCQIRILSAISNVVTLYSVMHTATAGKADGLTIQAGLAQSDSFVVASCHIVNR